jgi:hypothetical protein
MAIEETNEWICSAVDVEGGIRPGSKIKPVMRGVAANDLRWDKGQTLKIYFVNGDQIQQQTFMDIANLWIIDGVSLKLETTSDKKGSHIRAWIGPIKNEKSESINKYESLIGKQSMNPNYRDKVTFTVADVTDQSRMLHEFGHALGLVHEHFHKDFPYHWNREAVYNDLKELGGNWTNEAYVNRNVFHEDPEGKLPKDDEVTPFDGSSVMIYPIRSNWTVEKKGFTWGKELSEGDKATIRKLYSA